MKPHIFKTRGHWAVEYEPYPPLLGWGEPNVAVRHMDNFRQACAYAYLQHRPNAYDKPRIIHITTKEAL